MSGTTDIFGFNISDDDEEEFHPATDDNDADKENDNYVRSWLVAVNTRS